MLCRGREPSPNRPGGQEPFSDSRALCAFSCTLRHRRDCPIGGLFDDCLSLSDAAGDYRDQVLNEMKVSP